MTEVTPEPPGAAIERLLLDPVPIVELASVSSRSGPGSSETRARGPGSWRWIRRARTRTAAFEERAAALGARERNQIDSTSTGSHWIPASAGADARAKLSCHLGRPRVPHGRVPILPGSPRRRDTHLVCGDAAPAVLDRLVLGHLRDNVRGGGLDAVLDTFDSSPTPPSPTPNPRRHLPSSARSALAHSRSLGPWTRRKHTHTPADSDESEPTTPGTATNPPPRLFGDDDASFEFLGCRRL